MNAIFKHLVLSVVIFPHVISFMIIFSWYLLLVMKATDLTIGLSSGAYPAEVLPSQIYDPAASGEQKALPSSLVDEIRTAAESVSVGYSRIIRLCRRISQAVQGCTKGR